MGLGRGVLLEFDPQAAELGDSAGGHVDDLSGAVALEKAGGYSALARLS